MKVVIATGGTGGHIFLGKTIGDMLKSKGVEVVYITTSKGLGTELLPTECTYVHRFYGITCVRDVLNALFVFVPAFIHVLRIYRVERPSLVIGTGSYASFVPILVAVTLSIPTVMYEVDTVPGRVTRLLCRYVDKMLLAFPEARDRLGVGEVIGIPLRKSILKLNRNCELTDRPHILVMGGSQGAKQLTQLGIELAQALPEYDFTIITGTRIWDRVSGVKLPNLQLIPFTTDMASIYSNTQLVIARAGALSLAEFSYLGIPAILIPFPYATQDHQYYNALHFNKGAIILRESQATVDKLMDAIRYLLSDVSTYQQKCKAMREATTGINPEVIYDSIRGLVFR